MGKPKDKKKSKNTAPNLNYGEYVLGKFMLFAIKDLHRKRPAHWLIMMIHT